MRSALTLALAALPLPAAADPPAPDFARDVRPLLAAKCVRCHGPKRQEGGLRLDFRRGAFQGGDTGPAIVPGDASKGELVRRVASSDEKERMPPSGEPLTKAEADALRGWIAAGAKWPDDLAGDDPARSHWAFRPVARPKPPTVASSDRVRTPVDAFVLAGLEKRGLAFSPEADRRTLLRRLHLDLTGLPPTPDEIDAFLRDESPDAYGTVVDRLLASPHFGERWARHWLDLARFAESDGYENDKVRENAWRFRDWVIDAHNADLPFDRFTVDQLAGDLLPSPTPAQLVAAGFHRNALWNSAASADKEEYRTLAVKDRTDATGTAWLGLTLGCARCHSHKYDPLAHREYYRLYAFFNEADHDDAKLPDGVAPTFKPAKRTTFVHKRGNFLLKGDEVRPATPAFLPPLTPRGPDADRLDLARWLVDPANPLTARVAANHVWAHLFGHGLVRTPDNFGPSGEPPTHPELLDWLAAEFVRLGWSRKALIRVVVHSAAYRQSSDRRGPAAGDDPENHLLGRQNRFRVEAEVVRDLALAASGLLSPKVGGPSVVPPYPDGFLAHKFDHEGLRKPGGDRHRRGVYVHVQRTLTFPGLAAFDAADPSTPCARRPRSTAPVQALTLLNDPVFAECARTLGARLAKVSPDHDARLRFGFVQCLGRLPGDKELAVLAELVEAQRKAGASEEAVWAGVGRVLLNLDEFIHRR